MSSAVQGRAGGRRVQLVLLVSALAPLACGGGPGDPSASADGGVAGADGGGDPGGADGGTSGEDRFVATASVQVTEQRITEPAFQNGSAFAYVLPIFFEEAQACTQDTLFDQQGCAVVETAQPTCAPACGEDEFCYADPERDCRTECRPTCTRDCPEDTFCMLGEDGAQSCEPLEPFGGAGTIEVSGLTQPVALRPPSQSSVTFTDAVFSGSAVQVIASGTQTGHGLGAFDLSLAPPPEPVASPPLADLTGADFSGPLTVAWSPAGDDIEIELFASGAGGGYTHVVCRGSDAAGQHTIPGEVFSLLPPDVQAVRIDLKRIREQTDADVATYGSYYGTDLPERGEATLRLVRLETATVAF